MAGRWTLPLSAYDGGMTTIGERLRVARGRRGYTQPEAADAIGCAPRTYAAWERDEAVPQSHWITKIEKALGEVTGEAPGVDLAEQSRIAATLDAQVLIAEVGRRFALIPSTPTSATAGADWVVNRPAHLRKRRRTDEHPDVTEGNHGRA